MGGGQLIFRSFFLSFHYFVCLRFVFRMI
eukprot:COSAG06_NODE_72182_length_177_cov_33.840000_1_plen_28_part_01